MNFTDPTKIRISFQDRNPQLSYSTLEFDESGNLNIDDFFAVPDQFLLDQKQEHSYFMGGMDE